MQSQSLPFNVQVAAAPPTGISPDQTTIDINSPQTASIKDAEGATWTKTTQLSGTPAQIGILRNGVRVAQSVDLLTIKTGIVYNKDFLSGSGWGKWVNGWVASPAPF